MPTSGSEKFWLKSRTVGLAFWATETAAIGLETVGDWFPDGGVWVIGEAKPSGGATNVSYGEKSVMLLKSPPSTARTCGAPPVTMSSPAALLIAPAAKWAPPRNSLS